MVRKEGLRNKKHDDLLTVPHPLAVPQPVIVPSAVVVTGLTAVVVGVIVSILRVVCIMVGCVAVVVTVTVDLLSLPDVTVALVDLPPLLPGLADVVLVELEVPGSGAVGLKTPVVAVKDVFVLFMLNG